MTSAYDAKISAWWDKRKRVKNPTRLSTIPRLERTADQCLEAVENNGLDLEYVPPSLRTLQIYLVALREDGRALQYVPEEERTPDLCLEAVKEVGYALSFVPLRSQTPEVCLAATIEHGTAVLHIECDKAGLDPLIWFAAVNGVAPQALQWIPIKFRSPEVCFTAVKSNPVLLEFVPEHLVTPYLCWYACEGTWNALKFVPEYYKTLDLCMHTLKQYANDDYERASWVVSLCLLHIPERWHSMVREWLDQLK